MVIYIQFQDSIKEDKLLQLIRLIEARFIVRLAYQNKKQILPAESRLDIFKIKEIILSDLKEKKLPYMVFEKEEESLLVIGTND
jgi:hypothetical protein